LAGAEAVLQDFWRGLRGKETFTLDISKVPDEELVERLLAEFRHRYPRPFRVLVDERNQYMAASLLAYHHQNPEERILIVVGAGHATGMRLLLGVQLS